MAEQMKRGGLSMVLEGTVEVETYVDKKTNQNRDRITVFFWGGSQWVRLTHESQARLLETGQWVKLQGDVRFFKDQMSPGTFEVVEIDGKKIPPIAA